MGIIIISINNIQPCHIPSESEPVQGTCLPRNSVSMDYQVYHNTCSPLKLVTMLISLPILPSIRVCHTNITMDVPVLSSMLPSPPSAYVLTNQSMDVSSRNVFMYVLNTSVSPSVRRSLLDVSRVTKPPRRLHVRVERRLI